MPRAARSPAELLLFWLPLAGTWLLMAVEGPFLAAVIARLAEARLNLAAHGVAFAFAILVESPVIMLLSASTALVAGRRSLAQMQRFCWLLMAAVTLGMVALVLPPVWGAVAGLIGLPPEVARLTHGALLLLLPWPAAIGDRRFHQGLLIARGQTRRVAWATLVRLVAMGGTALLLATATALPGAWVAASSLSAGVVAEMLAVRRMVRRVKGDFAAIELPAERDDRALSLPAIGAFYLPMAMTSLLGLAVQPTITFFVGQSRMALDSLAVLPVIHSLTFLFRALGLSFHEVVVAQLGQGGAFGPLRDFALGLGAFVTLCMGLLAFTPLQSLWFEGVSGLDPQLAAFATRPLQVVWLLPTLSVLLSFQRALLVKARRTGPMGSSTALELGTVAVALALGIHALDWVGAVAAMAALMAGRLVGVGWLALPTARAARGFRDADQAA